MPPVWAAMPSLPWPELTSALSETLRDFALGASSSGTLTVSWTSPRSIAGFDSATVCGERACGEGSPGRIGTQSIRPGATSVAVSVRTGASPLVAGSFRMLALYGRAGDGMGLQTNPLSCPSRPLGQGCE